MCLPKKSGEPMIMDTATNRNSKIYSKDSIEEVDKSNPIWRYAKPHGKDSWGPRAIEKCSENDGTMVTVVCITYNHENYIAEALESFVNQKTTFKYKVLVGDDLSTDRTPDIIRDYAEKYPEIIIPIIRDTNVGANRNLIDTSERARSPFVAYCEGDDYWIDPNKLQTQFDYLCEHEECRACFCDTMIDAPDDWYLNSYYSLDEEGRHCIPSGIPGFDTEKTIYNAAEYISKGPAHTSSMFFRWNYDLTIPECYYEQASGDHSIMMMQIGKDNVGYIHRTMSAYRRSDVGVTMFSSKDEHFLKTRTDWVEVLLNLRDFFNDNCDGFAVTSIENRMKHETYNYFKTALKCGDTDLIAEFSRRYPDAMAVCLDAYLGFFHDSRLLVSTLGWNDYRFMVRNGKHRKHIATLSKALHTVDSIKALPGKSASSLKRKARIAEYWLNSEKEIVPGLWVFSGFKGTTYGDNSKYLFEYICNNRTEIIPVWITGDSKVAESLACQGLPVVMKDTSFGRRLMRSAEVAVTDHFVMSDYGRPRPLNKDTRVLQLWHGVGLKSMHNLGLTTVKGVEYADQYNDAPDDSQIEKLIKRRKRITALAKLEQCENYYMMVVPGKEMQDAYEDGFHLDKKKFFHCGYPRMDHLVKGASLQSSHPKILYAPTYRWSAHEERKLVKALVDGVASIEESLEALDAELVIRLHPHTWRSYDSMIGYAIRDCSRISIDECADVYEELDQYSVLITDYSSIAYDFLLLDRPMVFLCPDLDWYIEHENDLRYDFQEFTPGAKVGSWNEALNAVTKYLDNPLLDAEERLNVKHFFYDDAALDGRACQHIVDEMIRRLENDKHEEH